MRWKAETDLCMCRPLPFMQAQWLSLVKAGVPLARLRREVFGLTCSTTCCKSQKPAARTGLF